MGAKSTGTILGILSVMLVFGSLWTASFATQPDGARPIRGGVGSPANGADRHRGDSDSDDHDSDHDSDDHSSGGGADPTDPDPEIRRVELFPELSPPTVMLEGRGFCDDPVVRLSVTGGALMDLFVFDSADTFAIAGLPDDTPGGRRIELSCPGSTTASFDVAFGAQGPPGEPGPRGEEGPPGLQGPPGTIADTSCDPGQCLVAISAGQAVCAPCTTVVDCPPFMTRVGGSCIDDAVRDPMVYRDALLACHGAFLEICSIAEIATCDVAEPPSSECTTLTKGTAGEVRLWTRDFTTGISNPSPFNAAITYGSGNSLAVGGDGAEWPFFCCRRSGVILEVQQQPTNAGKTGLLARP